MWTMLAEIGQLSKHFFMQYSPMNALLLVQQFGTILHSKVAIVTHSHQTD